MGNNSLWNKALILSACFHLGVIPVIGLIFNSYSAAPLPEKPIELELVMSVDAQPVNTETPVQQEERINQVSKPKPPENTPQPIKNEPVNRQKTQTTTKDPEAVIDRNVEPSEPAKPAEPAEPTESTFANPDENLVNETKTQSTGPSRNNSSLNTNAAEAGTSAGYTRPQLLHKVEPVYPGKAKTALREGTVAVSLEVLSNGQVGKVTIRQSSGHADLDDAAVKAVKRWRFVPAKDRHSGQAITCIVNFPIVFQIK